MEKKKFGEINIKGEDKAEFCLTDVTLVYPDKEPRSINYKDVHLLQEMFVEEKKKYILGVYTKDPAASRTRLLTFGNFTDTEGFLEAFHSVKNAIHTLENRLIGFFGNLLGQEQKPKRCQLGIDHKHILIRAVEDDQTQFFRIGVDSCKVEEVKNQSIIKIHLLQSQLERIYFSKKEDVFAFKKLFYEAMEEAAKPPADVDTFKIYILENSPHLKSLHEKLVISGVMPDQEFWESRAEFQEYKKYFIEESKQKAGKSSGLFIKDKITSETEKQRILTQHPEVKGPYLLEVMDGDNLNFEKEKKFWEEFIKLQKKKDTVIVGGRNPVAIQSDPFQDRGEQGLDEVPFGDVDFLDMKTNISEKLLYEALKEEHGPAENEVESMIKRLHVHGMNILGGIKPASSSTIQEMIDELKGSIPEHLELPEEMQIKAIKGQCASNGQMVIEDFETQRSDSKNVKSNSENITARLQKLLESKKQIDNRAAGIEESMPGVLDRPEMMIVDFDKLVSASCQKEEAVQSSQFREIYKAYHEQAKDLLRLYNLIESSPSESYENKRRIMKGLINELIGKINFYLAEIAPGKTGEENKMTKLLETIREQLRFALKG